MPRNYAKDSWIPGNLVLLKDAGSPKQVTTQVKCGGQPALCGSIEVRAGKHRLRGSGRIAKQSTLVKKIYPEKKERDYEEIKRVISKTISDTSEVFVRKQDDPTNKA